MKELQAKGVRIIIFGMPIGGSPRRILDRTFSDQLAQAHFDEEGIKYVSVIESSKQVRPNKNDVHYGNRYVEYFNKVLLPHLRNF